MKPLKQEEEAVSELALVPCKEKTNEERIRELLQKLELLRKLEKN